MSSALHEEKDRKVKVAVCVLRLEAVLHHHVAVVQLGKTGVQSQDLLICDLPQ